MWFTEGVTANSGFFMTKKQIEKETKNFIKILGLINFDIEVDFVKKLRSKNTIAQSTWDSQYLTGVIEYAFSKLKDVDQNTVVHELVHSMTSELMDFMSANGLRGKMVDFFNERLVCTITNLILRIIKERVKYDKI